MAVSRVAIACQGGGSHTAFTAGALSRLLARPRFDVVGLSGTSGGAICALLAWNGLVARRRDPARALLAFWRDVSACEPWDRLVNEALVGALRFWGQWVSPESSPYEFPQVLLPNELPGLLARYAEPAELAGRVSDPGQPLLLISAVDVGSGRFVTFRGGGPLPASAADWRPVTLDAVLASAAVPSLFPAVEVDGDLYWDGLYSQNPPLRELLDTEPDELWIIQVDPTTRSEVPRRPAAIRDRRNELTANLSVQQETFFITKINQLIETGMLSDKGMRKYRHVEIRYLTMSASVADALDYESKLDRSPDLINGLIDHGQCRAESFLQLVTDPAKTPPAGPGQP
jgi:NTE family protein